jgi:hypothetical protein
MSAKQARGPVIASLLLTIIGVVLLLDNFLLFESIRFISFWPLLLVIAGATFLIRGDLSLDESIRTFGITRGSVESAVIEINNGEIDLVIRDLAREERLIAGKYAANTRPSLQVEDTHALVQLDRASTPWFNLADWELALAQDLPWQFFISGHLGRADLDLSKLIVEGGYIVTGFGDIQVTCPQETLAPLHLTSTLGNIRFTTPLGYKSRIQIEGAGTFGLHIDERRYAQAENNLYVARNARPDAPLVDIIISGTFGDAHLI